jgi:hypothetical protein
LFYIPETWPGNDGDQDEAADAAAVDGALPPMVKIKLWPEMDQRVGSRRRFNLGVPVSWRE